MPEARREIVSDTGPMISFEKIEGSFELLRGLYDRVLIPPEVLAELADGLPGGGAEYLRRYGLEELLILEAAPVESRRPDLDRGESAAIALAAARGLPLLIEERTGRRVARELGLSISGAAGQIRRGFLEGLLDRTTALDYLHRLYEAGRISATVLRVISEAISREPPA